jgi:uncharacterized membrane protein
MQSQGDNPQDKRGRIKARLSLATGAVLVFYPVLVYFGQSRLGVSSMALLFILICGLRLAASRLGGAARFGGAFGMPQLLTTCGVIVLALVSIFSGSPEAMLYYPVLVNTAMLLLFGSSLLFPPTIVEQIARLRHPHLPEQATPYLRRVTIAWCLFFVGNGAVAFYTATFASFETWTLYNGLIAYLLIGAMFAAELFTRARAMRSLRK